MDSRIKGTILLAAICLCLSASQLQAQNPARANGIGLRASYWHLANSPTQFRVSETGSTFSVSGVGAWLCYFSRLSHHWYLDFNLGTIARVQGEEQNLIGENVDVSLLIPFLLGARFDFLPARTVSSFQPYLAAGAGPYWSTSFRVENQATGEEVTGEGKINFGAYAGGGLNLVMTSWLAFNFDLKYHFVDLNLKRGFAYGDEFSGIEFGLGLSFMWGRKREMFRIKATKVIVSDVYPAYYQFYNTYPLALVTVQNVAGYAIDLNVQSFIRGYSERPKDTGFVRLEKGETKDIPVTAIFGPRFREASQRQQAVLDLKVEARAGGSAQQQISTALVVHGRNAWNGEIDKLGFFVTPEDENILSLSRRIASEVAQPEAGNFAMARAVLEELAHMQLRYRRDPNIPFYRDDRVQFAAETLELRTGDCDDLVVLCASLLESLGIKTAFVEVQDPEKTLAHLFLMFDSGVAPAQSEAISTNPKRYVTRANALGQEHLWIPIETTLIAQGFEEAWKAGALEYLQDGELRGGLTQGWVKIIEVE